MFAIDTGDQSQADIGPIPQMASVDDTMNIDLSNGQRAERIHRKIIANVEACETQEILDEYWSAETILLDGFYMEWPELWAAMDDVHDERCAIFNGVKATNVLGKTF